MSTLQGNLPSPNDTSGVVWMFPCSMLILMVGGCLDVSMQHAHLDENMYVYSDTDKFTSLTCMCASSSTCFRHRVARRDSGSRQRAILSTPEAQFVSRRGFA